mmetsp:Transcript_29960/g.49451  ORF Transcript_29960/g.49451 Transcript_29960/m.49451 type:complete len:338 (-) Transcript_29960:99-1112(-)|eukprot:CAMPEP_0119003710 /NCGR_PEP_ID=MMETSP1176-20130426/724_1 /TAXON_ID=265551 /ORGANISM="Synedropsis recta cf, Strain CCMP1620" /LENGTH=337 /DNA_ID=CAMNT_0006955335 /DNA_START=68 /DNA_END=1081 /DNA_ORIENTATION=+
MVKQSDLKSKDKMPSGIKRPTRKKPKDKPKRPLSAYNFFFKEEREKILKVVLSEENTKEENDPEGTDYISEEMMTRLRKEGGKVSFEEMGKLIGQRWKKIDPDRLSKYSELAAEDTERYKKEMQSYNGRQEAKMRSEALKPPAWNGGKVETAGGRVPGADAAARSAIPPQYNDTMSASFANQAAAAAAQMGAGYANPYAGMDLSGAYAMGGMSMGGMYPGTYGGYGMGGDPSAMGGAPGAAAAAAYGRQAGVGGPGASVQGMYAAGQMMMGAGAGAAGFQQAGMMGGYGVPGADPYAGQAGMNQAALQQYGLPTNDQMAYAAQQGYAADPSAGWGGQ